MAKEHNKRDLQSLPECAKDFIKLVIRKMRYRKKVRADVQAELAAHFEDELRDFATEQEREQKTQQIVEQFGDAKLLGILLRRAKKRCRPLWRTIIARTFQTTGVLILCLIVYVTWFLTGKPVITTNYVEQMNLTVRPFEDVDPNLNARPFYYKAAKIVKQAKEEKEIPEEIDKLFGDKYYELTFEQKELVRDWLDENKGLLDLVVAGAQKPYYWPEYKTGEVSASDEAIAVLMPHLNSYRILVYMLVRWRAYMNAEEGRYEQAFSDIMVCYRMGKHLKGDMTLIEQLVGISIEALATIAISEILSRYEIESYILAKLQSDLEKEIADEDFAISFEQERFFMYDEIQRSFTVDRIGGGHLYLKRVGHIADLAGWERKDYKRLRGILRILFTHPNKQETLAAVNRFYGRADELSQKSPVSVLDENMDIDKELEHLSKANFFLELLAPAVGRVVQLGHRNKAQIQATPLVIAIHRYKQDYWKLPENLDELKKAGYIKELPIDPYTDGPIVYRRIPGGFTVYSVGLNFVDDGGEIFIDKRGKPKRYSTKEGGDMVFWPVQKN